MEFFDSKEEVIEVQLTQYGKLLLAKGKLRPFYYAFYDDGVAYDSQHLGFEESQNKSEDRIKEETPRMKTQNMVFGSETKVKEHNKLVDTGVASLYEDYEFVPDPNERDNFLKYPLYCMPFYSGKKTPTLEAITDMPLFLTSSGVTYFTGSNVNLPIPQANAEVNYYIHRTHPPEGFVRMEDRPELSDAQKAEAALNYGTQDLLGDTVFFLDGNQIDVEGDGMFIEMFEALDNVDMSAQDYELEVFEIQESMLADNNRETILIPLRFEENNNMVDSLCIQQYFNMSIDDDVPEDRYRSNRGPRGKLFNRPPKPASPSEVVVTNPYSNVEFKDDLDCQEASIQSTSPGGTDSGGGGAY